MSLLSRLSVVALSICLALTVIPFSWSPVGPDTRLVLTPAWAGGSPDETLNPPPTPPKAKYTGMDHYSTTAAPAAVSADRRLTKVSLSWSSRMALVWRYYLTSVLRF